MFSGEKHSGRFTNSDRVRYTATFAFASSGKKIPVHLLFRELTGPEFERTQSQFQNDEMEYVYENESATWDESTVLLFLEEMLLPYIESHGGGVMDLTGLKKFWLSIKSIKSTALKFQQV